MEEQSITQNYIELLAERGRLAVIYPDGEDNDSNVEDPNTEEKAMKLLDCIDGAIGIGKFKNEINGSYQWGVIFDRGESQ